MRILDRTGKIAKGAAGTGWVCTSLVVNKGPAGVVATGSMRRASARELGWNGRRRDRGSGAHSSCFDLS